MAGREWWSVVPEGVPDGSDNVDGSPSYLQFAVDWQMVINDDNVQITPLVYRWDRYSTDDEGYCYEVLSPDASNNMSSKTWGPIYWGGGSGTRQFDSFATRTYTRGSSDYTVSFTVNWKNAGYANGSYYNIDDGWHTWTITIPALETSAYKKTIEHWAFGFTQGEGNNWNNTAFNLGQTSFNLEKGASKVIDSSLARNIPNGFQLRSQYRDYGASADKNIGTTYTQGTSDYGFEFRYDPITYNITYNLNGGTNNGSNPSTYNVLYGVAFSDPTRTGYKFAGWTIDGTAATGINPDVTNSFMNSSELYTELAKRTIGNKTVTANWSANTTNNLALSATSGIITYPTTTTSFTYTTSSTGNVIVKSDDTSIATASINTSTKRVTITWKGAGTTTIKVYQYASGQYLAGSQMYTITCKKGAPKNPFTLIEGLIYTGAAQGLIQSVSAVYGTATANTSTSSTTAPSSWITPTSVKGTAVKTYYVWWKTAGNTYYNAGQGYSGAVTINKATLSGSVEISGYNVVGETLTANVTNTNGAALSYQWYKSPNAQMLGTAITGAINSTYTINDKNLIGFIINLTVSASKENYNDVKWSSNTTNTQNVYPRVACFDVAMFDESGNPIQNVVYVSDANGILKGTDIHTYVSDNNGKIKSSVYWQR